MADAAAVDLKKLHRIKEVRSRDILFSIAQRLDNGHLLIGSSDAAIYEIDLAAEKPERLSFTGDGHRSYVTGLVIANNQAISASYDGRLVWWDLNTHTSIRAVNAHDKWIRRLLIIPQSQQVVSIADDMRCRVWNAANGERIADFSDHPAITPHHFPSMLYAAAASPDGKWLATGDRVGHVAIWDTKTWQKAGEMECPVMYTFDPKARRHSIGGIRSLAFSPDSARLAVGGTGKINNIDHLEGRARVEIFEWQTAKRLHELEDEKRKGLIEQILWLPETPYLLTSGGDHKGFITFYDTNTGEIAHQDGIEGHVHGLISNPTSTDFFIAAHERIEHWSLA